MNKPQKGSVMRGQNGIVTGYLIGVLLAGFIGFFVSLSITADTASPADSLAKLDSATQISAQ